MPQTLDKPLAQPFTNYLSPFEDRQPEVPTFQETLNAAFAQTNIIANMIELQNKKTFPEQPNFDLVTSMKTKGVWDTPDKDSYVGVRSDAELDYRIQRVAKQRSDQDVLARSGWPGYVAIGAAGLADPTIFIPFMKGATAIGSALKAGALVGATVTAEEVILQANQETRTAEEGLFSIAAGTVLGGVLGGAIHGLSPKAVTKMSDDMAIPPSGEAISTPMPHWDEPTSVGAFQVKGEGGKLYSQTLTKPVIDKLSKLSPVTRGLQQTNAPSHMPQGSPLVREVTGKFSQAGLKLEGNVEGFSAAPGGNIENVIKGYAGKLDIAQRTIEQAFKDYVFGNNAPRVFAMTQARLGARLDRAMMNFDEFKREVYLTQARQVPHENPAVNKAAEAVKKHIDELYQEGVETKVFTGEEEVKGDKGYISHLWDTVKIKSNENSLVQVLSEHYRAKKEAEFAKAFEKLQEKQSKAGNFIADAERSPEEVEALKEQFIKELAKVEDDLPYETAQIDLESKNLRAKARGAQGKDKDALLEKARTVELEGGEPLQKYKAQKGAIKTRLSNLAKARVSVDRRFQAKLDKIEKNEELQLETMLRAAKQAQKVLSLVGKGSDEAVAKELSKLKDMFEKTAVAFDRAEEQIVKLTSGDDAVEQIASPAVRVNGKVYTGANHGEASQIASRETGISIDKIADDFEADGFQTSTGRYVDRQEAFKLANKEGQLKKGVFTEGDIASDSGSLMSHGFELQRRQEARINKLDDYAERIESVDSFDRAALRAEVDDAAKWLIETHADIMAKRTIRNEKLKASAKPLAPEEFQKRLDARKQAAKELAPSFAERMRERGAEKIDLEKGTADFSAHVEEMAGYTVDKLKGTERRLAYSDLVQDKRGPELARILDIEADKVLDWLETDVQKVLTVYTRTVGADNTIAREFGSSNMDEVFVKLTDEQRKAISAIDGLKNKKGEPLTPEAKGKIEFETNKFYENARKDLYTLLERSRGMRGIPSDPYAASARLARVALDLNNVRYMGGAAIASIPDPARIVQKFGLLSTFRDAFVPFITQFKDFRISAREARLAGTANEIAQGSRLHAMTNVFEDTYRGTVAERGIHYLSTRMGLLSGLAHWTQAWQSFTAVAANAKMLDSIALMMGEKGTKAEISEATEYLAKLNITPDIAETIWKTADAGGIEKVGGVWLPNTELWNTADRNVANAQRAYRAALAGEVDDTIIRPGFEKPSFMDANAATRLFTQFKSFALASTQKTVMAGLQEHDMAYINGMMISLAMGALSYYLYAVAAGGKTYDTMQKSIEDGNWELWADEAISRSGQTAIFDSFQRVANRVPIINKVTSFSGGPRTKTIGGGLVDELGGPTLDLLHKLERIVQGAPEPNRSTAHAARQILPFQNLFYTRRLLNQIENAAGDAFGLEGQRQ